MFVLQEDDKHRRKHFLTTREKLCEESCAFVLLQQILCLAYFILTEKKASYVSHSVIEVPVKQPFYFLIYHSENPPKAQCAVNVFFAGELFAQAPVDQYPGCVVESVTDSSRYFVIRIEDGNGKTFSTGYQFK